MRIGIDIDDTLVNTTDSYKMIMKKYGVSIDLLKKGYNSSEMLNFLYKYHDDVIKNATFKKGAVYYLNKLAIEGNTLIIITARGNTFSNVAKSITNKFIYDNKLPIEKIYYDCHNKSDICKLESIDLMVDDNIDVCASVKKEGIDYLLFDSENNQSSNFKRVKSWEEVYDYVRRNYG